ncbi:MAG: hypothetical protein M1835_001383 [Candelina submexicana]|nr:MAG: hypothetical protein M1835_001383 [Candelina submexicana]
MESPYSDECVIGRGLRQISSPAHGLAQPSSNSPLPAPVTTRKPSATSSSESDGGCHLSSQPPKTGSNFSHSADPIELESGTVWRPFSYIVRNPPPLHIMSHSGRFFGGPTVAVHPGGKLAGWAKYHLVPANGILDTVESEDLRLFNNQVGSNTAAGTAAIFGLAAGRMVVVLSGGQTLKLSGFWVDGDIFITCEHFYEDGMDETQRAAEKEYLMRGSTGRGHHYATTVSSLLCANNNGPEACQVRLVASDHDADISVWVAMRPRKAPGHSVLLSQLRGHDDHTSWTVVPTFTVCYASGDWNWSKKEKADNAQETLMSGYNKANEGRLTQYSFLRRQYLSAALPNKELDFELEKNSIQQLTSIPNLKNCLNPTNEPWLLALCPNQLIKNIRIPMYILPAELNFRMHTRGVTQSLDFMGAPEA